MQAEEFLGLGFQTLCVSPLFGSQFPEFNEGHTSRNVFFLSFHQPGESFPASPSVANANFLRDHGVFIVDAGVSHCPRSFHMSEGSQTARLVLNACRSV